MQAIHLSETPLEQLIARLDLAVATESEALPERVRDAVALAIQTHPDLLPTKFLQPISTGYARRAVHHDPLGRYSVIAMVWAPGQGTPLHDHDGRWCVECIVQGSMRVTSYALLHQQEGRYDFERSRVTIDSAGDAEAFIPPFEFHTMENAGAEVAVTLHVYAGELTTCRVFTPSGEGYLAEQVALSLIE